MDPFIQPKQMVTSPKTAREIFEDVMANPARKRFGFGEKLDRKSVV